tara:strand:+ start:2679 stop:4925 length:2247 start_codon:yes stop_codon:yes gene_type:complete
LKLSAKNFNKTELKISSERKQVIVIGAGISGICAAVAAARQGASVALIEQRNSLGGRIGSECRFPFEDINPPNFPYSRESGLLDEILLLLALENREGNYLGQGRVLRNFLIKEPRLEIFLNQKVFEVDLEKSNNRIAAVVSISSVNSNRKHFKGNYFIDCSGGGFISQMAGAEGETGIDQMEKNIFSKNDFQSRARIATTITIARAEQSIPFECPSWVRIKWLENIMSAKLDLMESLSKNPVGDHNLEWLGPGLKSNISSEEIAWATWDYIKNHSPMKDSFKPMMIENISPFTFVRDGFRGTGDYILKPKDIIEGKRFSDSVALGRAPLDTENGLLFSSHGKVFLHQPFEIPFRCLHSKTIHNLLWTGEYSSATSHASSSLNHPPTSAQMGEAAGLAAALASESKSLGILRNKSLIKKLQKSLYRRNHQISLDLFSDEENLVLDAKISPSSNLKSFLPSKYSTGKPLLFSRGMIQFPLCTKTIQRIQLFLETQHEITLEWRLLEGSSHNHALPGVCIDSGSVRVSKNHGKWVEIEVNSTIKSHGWHFLELKSSEPIRLHTQKDAPPGILFHRSKTNADQAAKNPYSEFVPVVSCCPEPPNAPLIKVFPSQSPYLSENVMLSNNRPTNLPNLWVSQSTDFKYPEYLDFQWKKQILISSVEIIFDSSSEFLFPRRPKVFENKIISSLVKDYNLYFQNKFGHSKKILEIRNNSKGFQIHKFEPVRTNHLELEIISSHGINRAQLYQFRAFK